MKKTLVDLSEDRDNLFNKSPIVNNDKIVLNLNKNEIYHNIITSINSYLKNDTKYQLSIFKNIINKVTNDKFIIYNNMDNINDISLIRNNDYYNVYNNFKVKDNYIKVIFTIYKNIINMITDPFNTYNTNNNINNIKYLLNILTAIILEKDKFIELNMLYYLNNIDKIVDDNYIIKDIDSFIKIFTDLNIDYYVDLEDRFINKHYNKYKKMAYTLKSIDNIKDMYIGHNNVRIINKNTLVTDNYKIDINNNTIIVKNKITYLDKKVIIILLLSNTNNNFIKDILNNMLLLLTSEIDVTYDLFKRSLSKYGYRFINKSDIINTNIKTNILKII